MIVGMKARLAGNDGGERNGDGRSARVSCVDFGGADGN